MLKLKPEFHGLIITKNIYIIGSVTLDTNIVKEEHYENFYNIGFQEFFDRLTVEPEIKPILNNVEIKTAKKKNGRQNK